MVNSFREAQQINHNDPVINTRVLAPFIRETLGSMKYGSYEVFESNLSERSRVFVGNVILMVADDDYFESQYQENDFRRISENGNIKFIDGFVKRPLAVNSCTKAFVREGLFANVMSVTGHELGHAFSDKLEGDISEEAKAYAFERAWCDTIDKNNIGNLKGKISRRVNSPPDCERFPAHYKAHQLVAELSKKMPAIEVYEGLKRGSLWAI